MASSYSSSSPSVEDVIVLELTDTLALEENQFSLQDEISISASDIQTWNLDSILRSKVVKVHASRSLLVQESSYFRGLLGGSFSESDLQCVPVQWNIEAVVNILQFLYSCSINVTSDNFLLLLEASLFFGVDKLFLECEVWFSHVASAKGLRTRQIPLETIIEIWKFGCEHGISSIRGLCEHYLAQHFVGAETYKGERTVKKLRLSKALTISESTMVSDACKRMAARRVDAVLLTDANGLLSGIVTDKDISTRVIAEGLRTEQTVVSKIMTRNPTFVMADTLSIEALQKMVQGKFRHLPVVENGEVIAMLDITKCLYDAISRMEKAALAAAVEGVERQWGSNFSAPYASIETLRELMFKPSLSTIIAENAKVAMVSPSDSVYVATKKMRKLKVNSVVITTAGQLQGILTSKDVLMRVVVQGLSPELTLVEKVMNANPESVTVDTTILEALHVMHDGKFLHLPVLDRDVILVYSGSPIAC